MDALMKGTDFESLKLEIQYADLTNCSTHSATLSTSITIITYKWEKVLFNWNANNFNYFRQFPLPF